MFHGWTHGHSIGTGIVGGLLLDQRSWALALGCVLLGLIVGRFWWVAVHAARRASARLEELHQSKLANDRLTRSIKRTTAKHRMEAFWTRKRDVQAQIERAYAQGVSEGIASYRP